VHSPIPVHGVREVCLIAAVRGMNVRACLQLEWEARTPLSRAMWSWSSCVQHRACFRRGGSCLQSHPLQGNMCGYCLFGVAVVVDEGLLNF